MLKFNQSNSINCKSEFKLEALLLPMKSTPFSSGMLHRNQSRSEFSAQSIDWREFTDDIRVSSLIDPLV